MTEKPAPIYLSAPHPTGKEIENLRKLIDGNRLAQTEAELGEFERRIAEQAEVGHAVALSSGTAALHLALIVLGVGPGDAVVCPTFTFVASANPIMYVGATPVFVDCRPETWTIDPDLLEQALASEPTVKAVITVDAYGQCCDYVAIREICRRRGVALIQDAAESLGSKHAGAPAGGQGDVAIFSFNGNKIMTTSGGGMLVSDDQRLIKQAKKLAGQGRADRDRSYYVHNELGFNYRLSTLLGAFGRAQLDELAGRVEARREIRQAYQRELADVPGISFMPQDTFGLDNAWLTCILLDHFPLARDTVWRALRRQNIETRALWNPMHKQPIYRRRYPVYGGAVSERLFEFGLCLPSGSSLTEAERHRVVAALRRLARQPRRARPHGEDA